MARNGFNTSKLVDFYLFWKFLLNNPHHRAAQKKTAEELAKKPARTDIINFLLSRATGETNYLELGVGNPCNNYSYILATNKYSVDPGCDYKMNQADYKMTSDMFFDLLKADKLLSRKIRFDVILIDGLHLAEQVDRDIINSLGFIKDDGFIVLHDCNPPTEWHAREEYSCYMTPAGLHWNGTTWKTFLKWRFDPQVYSCCIDSDFGVGILSKGTMIGQSINKTNQFFEFANLSQNRKEYLNLMSFDEFTKLLK